MKEQYGNLNSFRVAAAFMIIMMHIRTNGSFAISGFLYDGIIATFGRLTLLFMALSAFSLCCGYFDSFKNGTQDLGAFYKKRYSRIWPFFAVLCTVELIVSHNLSSLYEWLADLTLAFGFFPNANISVVGVGWFLGIIFVFYMIFPFFVFLIRNKKRAWLVMGIAILLNILCQLYFFDSNHVLDGFSNSANMAYSFMFFVAGGLIFLYRQPITKFVGRFFWGAFALTAAVAVFFFLVNNSAFTLLVLFALVVMLGISAKGRISKALFQNRVAKALSGVSFEIYLCHMFIFRLLEKVHFIHLTGNEIVNYVLTVVVTICGALLFAWLAKFVINKISKVFREKRLRRS